MGPAYRDIDGFEGYRVGDDGSIWSRRLPSRKGRLSDSWSPLKPIIDGQTGYGRVALRKDGRTFRRYVHHLVLEAFIGPRPEGMEGCHNNGIKTDNRLVNLRWDTPASNQADKLKHGTSNRGRRHPLSKLREGDIPEIFAIRRDFPAATMEDIGILYGVSKTAIQNVLKRRNWGWLELEGHHGVG